MTLASNVGHEAEENTIGEDHRYHQQQHIHQHFHQNHLDHPHRDDQQGRGQGGVEEAQGQHLGLRHRVR